MFKIGEFSKLCNTTVRMLRHYAALELLLPEKTDDFTGYRYYSVKQLEKLNQIKLLQQTGLPLKTIKEILETDNLEFLERHYNHQEIQLQEIIDGITKKQRLITVLKQKIKEEKSLIQYNVVLKEIPTRNVLSVRKKILNYNHESELWGYLLQGMHCINAKRTTPPLYLTIFHDNEYMDKNADVEVQVTVEGEYKDHKTIKFLKEPVLKIASVTYNGNFDQVNNVVQAIGEWIEANDYKISGPMINISHISPAQDSNPENWITETAFVVKR